MKRKQIQGLGLVEAVSLALVVALIGTVGYIVLLSDDTFKLSQNEVEPQPPIPALPHDAQNLTEEEREKAIELAVSDPGVKEWLEKGYEIYKVVPLPLPPLPPHSTGYDTRPCIVYILTEEQELPWVLGVTLKVSVDLNQEKVHGFDFNLNLASLREDQKEEVLRIALADPEVLEIIGDEEYEIRSEGLGYWKSCHEGECSFHVYPHANIIVNTHARFPEIITKVDIYVDLESEEIVKINSLPKQVPPPPPGKENTYEIPLIELEGDIKFSISERFTEEKDGAHIFLNLATERIYGCCDHQLNSDVKIQGDTIIVEVKNVHKCGHAEGRGPATFSEDLGKIEGDYQLILKHKTKEDKYNLKITKDKIEINPLILTFTVFNQSNILFRVPENVIWIDCGHYDRVGCEENQEYIIICDRFFKEPLISNLQPFEPEEGEYAVKWFNKEHKHFKFFGNISDLRELVESYAIYTSRDINDKERCLLLSIRTWRGDFFYTWDYTWEKRKNV